MTIKELHDITGSNTKIFISWDGSINELDRENSLVMEAYGRFTVARINPLSGKTLEAIIKAIPATE